MIQTMSEPVANFETYFARRPAPAKIGVFACGHALYWPQFKGLKEQLMSYHYQFVKKLEKLGVEVIDGGMSDSQCNTDKVTGILRQNDVDLLIANVVTYSTSGAVLPVIQKTCCPVALVALQPADKLDYDNATTYDQLCNDNVTSLPEICNAMTRSGIKPADIIFGQLDEKRAWNRIEDLCRIARGLHILRHGRIGLMGHTYEGMLDMNSDPTMFTAQLGLHIQHIELDDLACRVKNMMESAIDERIELIHKIFHFPPQGSDPIAGEVEPDELRWAARVSLGMESLIQDFNLDGLAYYYRGIPGSENERLGCSLIIGSSLLTGRGIPIAGEFDTKTCVAMLIMDRIGAGGSFAELHPVDFDDDFVLVGHDGPHHVAIAEGRPVMRGLSVLHGKAGRGPSVEFALKTGPITMLGLTQTAEGRFKFVIAEGQSLPGAIPATGNTNTRGRFKPDVRTFIERWSLAGPTHHFALGVGLHGKILSRLAEILNLDSQIIASE